MTDKKTLAYINMFAVLGSLPRLCELDKRARRLTNLKEGVSIAFDVTGGPKGTFTFKGGKCYVLRGIHECDIRLFFKDCDHFNGMIDGRSMPIPTKGLTKIGFLTKNFTKLTDILASYLRPSEEDEKNEELRSVRVPIMLNLIGNAVAEIGNHDKVGMFSASNIEDGTVKLSIKNGPAVYIRSTNHILTASEEPYDSPRAIMEFGSLDIAQNLFNGETNSYDCIGKQMITMCGMISMLDNVNRILDRVSLYLE